MDDIAEIENYKPTGKVCRCINDCIHDAYNTTCELLPRAKCFKKITLDEYGEPFVRAGCLNSRDTHIDQCSKWAHPQFEEPTAFACCDNVTLCNDFLDIHLPLPPTKPFFSGANRELLIGVFVTLASFVIFIVVGILVYRAWLRREERRKRKQIENENRHLGCLVMTTGRRKGGEGRKMTRSKCGGRRGCGEEWGSLQCTTSSGSGVPLLMQRTIANQIQVVREIGRGRYGTVMLGSWREEKVALKVFNSVNEDSWNRETEIYQTVLLRHENILGFIAADICGIDSVTKMYLITEYHQHGSLHDYLLANSVSPAQALKFTHSASCGLAHLHTEITGTKGKPAIAHRDVKTKNLLVKNDGQCCVADMGLAVRYSRNENKVDVGTHSQPTERQGTKRYMAPEVLEQAYNSATFDAYKRIDVYGFSLVLWEVLNRMQLHGVANEYRLPYHDVVGCDPDFDEMKKVVAVANMRPHIEPRFACHQIFGQYCQTMRECWSARPQSRLSMLRVRKTLMNLRQQVHNQLLHQQQQNNKTHQPHQAAAVTRDDDRKVSLSSEEGGVKIESGESSNTTTDSSKPLTTTTT